MRAAQTHLQPSPGSRHRAGVLHTFRCICRTEGRVNIDVFGSCVCVQSSLASTAGPTAPSFQSYAPFSRAPYSQFSSSPLVPQPFGAAVTGGEFTLALVASSIGDGVLKEYTNKINFSEFLPNIKLMCFKAKRYRQDHAQVNLELFCFHNMSFLFLLRGENH